MRDEPKVDERVVDYASVAVEDEESSESQDAQESKASEVQKDEGASSNLPTRVSAVNAQGLDLSVLDGSVSGDTVDSVDGDPTVALSPDEVEELLQRMVDRQDPEDSVALAELAADESAKSKSARWLRWSVRIAALRRRTPKSLSLRRLPRTSRSMRC